MRKSMKTPKIFSILDLSLDHDEKAVLIKAADGLSMTLNLSHFRVSHKLGEGKRHTVVYLARHPTEDKNYAIKSIMKHSLNANTIAAMLLEYQILYNDFHHSHCKLQYCYMSEERLYFVMEFISGATLQKALISEKNEVENKKGLSEEHARAIIAQLVVSVGKLHSN